MVGLLAQAAARRRLTASSKLFNEEINCQLVGLRGPKKSLVHYYTNLTAQPALTSATKRVAAVSYQKRLFR